MDESFFMRRAIELAKTATGWTNPNPIVGAVIVKDGDIIGEGCHERYGDKHAERNALLSCTRSPQGSTVYITLEPCDHTGRQPSCTEALIEAQVARVVVGSRDPNPLVSGRGVAHLREAGIEVECDFLRGECDSLNPIFFHYMMTGLPYTVAKWAMTADGRAATSEGDSRWVSGPDSRADVHEYRHRLSAIMIGIGTVMLDDPLLTCRRASGLSGNNPLRVICDSRLRIPEDCKLITTLDEAPLLIATAADTAKTFDTPTMAADPNGASDSIATVDPAISLKVERLRNSGIEVVSFPGADGHVDLASLMRYLGHRAIDSVLLEGGAGLLSSAFEDDLVDEAIVYVAPKIVGGADARGPVAGAGVVRMADALALGRPEISSLGDDVKLIYHLNRHTEAAVRCATSKVEGGC